MTLAFTFRPTPAEHSRVLMFMLRGARRLRNASFVSAPQLKRDPLGSAMIATFNRVLMR
jgi:hypothetical protein